MRALASHTLPPPTCARSRASLRRGEASTSGRPPTLAPRPAAAAERWPTLRARRMASGSGVATRLCVRAQNAPVVDAQPKAAAGGEDGSQAPDGGELYLLVDSERCLVPEKYRSLPSDEQARRIRISRKNKGSTPWNKGRKHSEATRALIRKRTREAMQRESVKAKCAKYNRNRPNLSKERKAQISVTMKRRIKEKKVKAMMEGLLVEPSKEEKEKKKKKKKVVKKEKKVKQPKDVISPNAPKSEVHRKKIADAIKKKWLDPNYQMRQKIGIARAMTQPRKQSPKKSAPKKMNSAQEKKYLEVVKYIKQLEDGIRDLETQRDLLWDDVESVKQIDQVLNETRAMLNSMLDQIKPIHKELGSKLGVDLDFDSSHTDNHDRSSDANILPSEEQVDDQEFPPKL